MGASAVNPDTEEEARIQGMELAAEYGMLDYLGKRKVELLRMDPAERAKRIKMPELQFQKRRLPWEPK